MSAACPAAGKHPAVLEPLLNLGPIGPEESGDLARRAFAARPPVGQDGFAPGGAQERLQHPTLPWLTLETGHVTCGMGH